MSNFYHPKDNCVFLHGTYVPPDTNIGGHDAIVACVKNVETGESELHIIKDPPTQVYVTKEGLRRYDHKREYARISDCDMYITPYKAQYSTLAEALKIRNQDPFFQKRAVEASPYAYTWDITPLIRMKCEYLDHTTKSATNLRIGMLDLETSVLGDEQILCASICSWPDREVHCFILNDPWLRIQEDEIHKLYERAEKEHQLFADGLNEKARKIWDKQPVKPVFHLCADEKELNVKMFEYFHKCKFDFIGIWNMGYDVPYIKQRAEFRQLDLAELWCSPDVPSDFRMFEWKEDKTKVDHFTDVWHIVNAPGYTYWYDAMALYSRLRKVKGRDILYTLDYIGNKIIGSGKMQFGTNQSHYLMQTNDKIGYCVYNTLDVIIPCLMDAITYDVASMIELADCAMLQDFAKQTVQLKAQFYKYLINQRLIPGSVAGSIKQPFDDAIGNIGGAVLNPTLMKRKGIPCLQESDMESAIYRLAMDLDVSSFYPSVTVACNISRETKLASVLWIEGCPYEIDTILNEKEAGKRKEMAKANAEYFNTLFGRVPFVRENAVAIGHEYFGLPDYSEMLQLIEGESEVQQS